jgi:hypothetical protein
LREVVSHSLLPCLLNVAQTPPADLRQISIEFYSSRDAIS